MAGKRVEKAGDVPFAGMRREYGQIRAA